MKTIIYCHFMPVQSPEGHRHCCQGWLRNLLAGDDFLLTRKRENLLLKCDHATFFAPKMVEESRVHVIHVMFICLNRSVQHAQLFS